MQVYNSTGANNSRGWPDLVEIQTTTETYKLGYFSQFRNLQIPIYKKLMSKFSNSVTILSLIQVGGKRPISTDVREICR
jgi:hypothetical protein